MIAIIGVLIGLLLPAVQSARESSRIAQCAHNLRQVGLAVFAHEQALGHLPAGGWGWRWTGDPDRGYGAAQPGGWLYNILPFMDQQSIHELGHGVDSAAKRAVLAQRAQISIPFLNCPSRRSGLFLCDVRRGREPYNQAPIELVARSDYAGNLGDRVPPLMFPPGPSTLEFTDAYHVVNSTLARDPAYAPFYVQPNGTFYLIRYVRMRDVVDGRSNTYLAGEKYIQPEKYETGQASGDDQNLYVGGDRDIFRWASATYIPQRDTPGVDNNIGFGSCHVAGVNMLFCDGSVHRIAFEIDREVHRGSGNRMDVTKIGL